MAGFVMAVFVIVVWFPASVFRGMQIACGAPTGRAIAATVVSYAAWLVLIGREFQTQLGHLV